MIFDYKGQLFPDYLKRGNACQFITPAALHFCKGKGVDVGSGRWPLPGARAIDFADGGDAMRVDETDLDFVFSSHCLEHLANPVAAIEHWRDRLVDGGVLFLYLPHPAMRYWRPQNCRKHLHLFHPEDTAEMLRDLGFVNVMHGDRDLAWSFAVVGFK